jgi:hypothetical protein
MDSDGEVLTVLSAADFVNQAMAALFVLPIQGLQWVHLAVIDC